MTIQEVIKSGKPFRRRAWTMASSWVCTKPSDYGGGDFICNDGYGGYPHIYVGDILADDWMVIKTGSEPGEK